MSKASPAAHGAQHHHRSALKQKNKPFKGTTKAKAASQRGKVDSKTLAGAGNGAAPALGKADRRNQRRLRQQAQRAALDDARRMFAGREGVARTVVLLGLTPRADTAALLRQLHPEMTGHVFCEPFKQNLRFFLPDRTNLLQVLDAASAADTVLFAVDARDAEIDKLGVDVLEVLRAQGLCTAAACVSGLEGAAPGRLARQNEMRAAWLHALRFHLGGSLHERLFSTDHFEARREGLELMRTLCQLPVYEGISWRDVRPYVVAQRASFAPDTRVLSVVGHVRGAGALSPDQLCHVSGVGDLPVARLTLLAVSRAARKAAGPVGDAEEDGREGVPVLPTEAREQLCRITEEDAVPAPDAEEQAMRDIADKEPLPTGHEPCWVRVPKGTSAYQAKIIHDVGLDINSDNGSDSDGSEDAEETELVDINARSEAESDSEDEEGADEDDGMDGPVEQDEPDRDLFPDAVSVPGDQSARARFAKYRGLESLRTSEWDESADAFPAWWGSLVAFADFKATMHRALRGGHSGAFRAGALVQLDLDCAHVPEEHVAVLQQLVQEAHGGSRPLTVYGLLAHEQRYSVLNYAISAKPVAPTMVIGSKQVVLAVCGFRRLEVSAVYSDAQASHALHLYLKTMPRGGACVCSFVGPVTYPPAPVLLFSGNAGAAGAGASVTLYATGSLSSVRPERKVLKRITFTGHPFKLHRRLCTARGMFSNASDVNWFRPVGLVASHSHARGHIKESLGTHGYMKCVFDRQIQQNEQIGMHLYKRVFPKLRTRVFAGLHVALDNQ